VARSRSATNAERDVVRVCHSGLDVGGVQAQVLRSLRRLVPVDAAFFATADPVTLQFTGAYSEEPLVAAAPRFLANELAGADVNTFTSLATSAAHVATLDSATGRARLDSERYREIDGDREHPKGGEQDGKTADGDQRPAQQWAGGVTEALEHPVAAERTALPLGWGKARDQDCSGRGEGRRRGALAEAGQPDQCGVGRSDGRPDLVID